MPTKPSGVQLQEMKTELANLRALHASMSGADSAHIDSLMNASNIGLDLQPSCDLGTQGDVATNVSERYETALSWIAAAHKDLVAGVGTMINLLSATIEGHSTADINTGDGAKATGTAATSSGSSAPNTSVPNASTAGVN